MDGGNIAGAATAGLRLTSVVVGDAAGYSVVVSNGFGSVTSAVAQLTVNVPVTVDIGFSPGAGRLDPYGGLDPYVFSLAVQADGKILVGGWFTALGGQPRDRIGRLNNTESATQSLN